MSTPEVPAQIPDFCQTYQTESKWHGLFRDFSITPDTFSRQFVRGVLLRHIAQGESLRERATKISVFARQVGELSGRTAITHNTEDEPLKVTLSPTQASQYAYFAHLLPGYVDAVLLTCDKNRPGLHGPGAVALAQGLCEVAFPAAWAPDMAANQPAFNRRLYGPTQDLFFRAVAEDNLLPPGGPPQIPQVQ